MSDRKHAIREFILACNIKSMAVLEEYFRRIASHRAEHAAEVQAALAG